MTAYSRPALLILSLALGLLEIADGFRLELPWMAWGYALMLIGGAMWLWRTGSVAAIWLLGALHLLELCMLLFVFRTAEQAPPVALWWLFVAVSLGGTLAAGSAVLSGRRAVRS